MILNELAIMRLITDKSNNKLLKEYNQHIMIEHQIKNYKRNYDLLKYSNEPKLNNNLS